MARRHGAVAAINGDYTILPSSAHAGRPINTFAEDGQLKTSPMIYGRNFSISRDEQTISFGHDRLDVWMTQLDTNETWDIDEVNPPQPDPGGFSAYTRAGSRPFSPARSSCAVRLFEDGPPTWTPSADGMTQAFHVDEVVCRSEPLPRRGGVVITTPIGSANAPAVAALIEGEPVTYGWSLRRRGVLDTVGGNPDLLEDGQQSVGECTSSYFCGRNPRTGIGATPEGKLLLVTVDGRRPGRSVGMTPWEFAGLFRYLGATDALNLDGGGSTTMVVRGQIVNTPSGGYERAVGSALLVLLRPDRKEIEPAPNASPSPPPSSTPTLSPSPSFSVMPSPTPTSPVSLLSVQDETGRFIDPGCQALLDPGSTGGLLDALARGDLGGTGNVLPGRLRWGLRVFRGKALCDP